MVTEFEPQVHFIRGCTNW